MLQNRHILLLRLEITTVFIWRRVLEKNHSTFCCSGVVVATGNYTSIRSTDYLFGEKSANDERR